MRLDAFVSIAGEWGGPTGRPPKTPGWVLSGSRGRSGGSGTGASPEPATPGSRRALAWALGGILPIALGGGFILDALIFNGLGGLGPVVLLPVGSGAVLIGLLILWVALRNPSEAHGSLIDSSGNVALPRRSLSQGQQKGTRIQTAALIVGFALAAAALFIAAYPGSLAYPQVIAWILALMALAMLVWGLGYWLSRRFGA